MYMSLRTAAMHFSNTYKLIRKNLPSRKPITCTNNTKVEYSISKRLEIHFELHPKLHVGFATARTNTLPIECRTQMKCAHHIKKVCIQPYC